MKMLLGLTGTNSVQGRNVRRALVDSLNVMHVNIKQPVIDMMASLFRITPHEYEHHFEKTKTITQFNQPANNMFRGVEASICAGNKNTLIDLCINAMARQDSISDRTEGTLISGINNDTEANFVRSRGGQIIHLINQDHLELAELVRSKNDFFIYINNKTGLTDDLVSQMLTYAKASNFFKGNDRAPSH